MHNNIIFFSIQHSKFIILYNYYLLMIYFHHDEREKIVKIKSNRKNVYLLLYDIIYY